MAADGSPRLADFGVSNIMVQSIPAFSYHTGAVRWTAPELIDLPEGTMPFVTKFSDIYSLGCIMLQVSPLLTMVVSLTWCNRCYTEKFPIGG